MSSADKIKVVDTNGDGVLSAEEHEAGSRSMFVKMDSDGDGMLSKGEYCAGHAKLMAKMWVASQQGRAAMSRKVGRSVSWGGSRPLPP